MGFFDLFKGWKSEDANTIYRQSGYGATELFLKAYSGDADSIASLLAQGADPNERSFVNFPDSEIIASARKGRELTSRGYASGQVPEMIWGKDMPVQALALMMQTFGERQKNPYVYYHTELGFSPLFFPVLRGDADVVKLLIDAGASPNAVQFNGTFPLYIAAIRGNLTIVKMLLAAGAEIDRKTPNGATALRAAIDAQQFDVAVHLIVNGADLNAWADDGLSILGAAISKAEWSLAGLIFFHSSFYEEEEPLFCIDSEVESNCWNSFAMPIGVIESDDFLESLAGIETGELSWKLIAASATDGSERIQPEHYTRSMNLELLAACSGSYGYEIAEMMHGIPAIHEASCSDEPFLLFFVTRRTVHLAPGDSAIADFFHQLVRNYHLARAVFERDEEMLKVCLAGGADLNQECYYGKTRFLPIVLASMAHSQRMCELLVEAGADVNKPQPNSETALTYACMSGDARLADWLLCHGADPNTKTVDGTALSQSGGIDIIHVLSARGANPNLADDRGILPIEHFIELGRQEAVSALMLRGADVDHANSSGMSPIDMAGRLGNDGIVRNLVDGCAHDAPYPEVNLGCMREKLVWRIINLTLLKYPLSHYCPSMRNDKEAGQISQIGDRQRESYVCVSALVDKAVESKRSGDLRTANMLFKKAMEGEDLFVSDYVFEWFQVYLLAKNFRDAQIVLRYYHAIVASYVALLKDAGIKDELIEGFDECYQSQQVRLPHITFDCMDHEVGLRALVESRIRRFGGSDFWKSFSLTENDYDLFLRYLVVEGEYRTPFVSRSVSNEAVLKAAADSGDTMAFELLARKLVDEDDVTAASLCKRGIAAGDFEFAPYILACLIRGNDVKKASDLCEFVAKYYGKTMAIQMLIDMVEADDPNRAIHYLEMLVKSGDVKACSRLALLVFEHDAHRAIGLCEEAIRRGDEDDAPFFLALILEKSDPERSKELYQTCIDRGHAYSAARHLAMLIEADEPNRAIELYELSIAEGNALSARDLAYLYRDSNPGRAKELFSKAIDLGDEEVSSLQLALMVMDEDPEQAKCLFARSFKAGNRLSAPYWLASLLEKDNPDEAVTYYRIAADAGDPYACERLAWLIYQTDRDFAVELCKKAVESGESTGAEYLLASMLKEENPRRSKELYEQCLREKSYVSLASYYLADLIERDEPARAVELYELSISEEFLPAYSKLARLVSEDDRSRAIELCEHAIEAGDVYDAPFYLAWLIEGEDPERAKQLYRICIDNGYIAGAANNLANVIKVTDPDGAKLLFEQSIEAGNNYYATGNLADMLVDSNPERAAELYRLSIDAGNVESYAKLARLVADADENLAIELCEQAVEQGDRFDGPFFLAWLLEIKDPERSKMLYQMCVDNGNCFNAANNLAYLIKDVDPERAIGLFEVSLAEGNTYYAAKNLADMLRESDESRAAELYQLAVDAGNVLAYSELARLVSDSDKHHAIELCEQAVELGDVNDAPYYLAWLLSDEDPERSKELYQLCVDNGYWYGAAYNLAYLVIDDDPGRAIDLFRKAADAGRAEASNSAGVFAMKQSAALAADFFNKAINAGDKLFAPCNLAHMIVSDDASRAEELYKLALDNETNEEATEALIGLYLLFEHKNREAAQDYLTQAKNRSNFKDGIEFMVDYYNAANTELAQRVQSIADTGKASIDS